jgi:hypothetical protein
MGQLAVAVGSTVTDSSPSDHGLRWGIKNALALGANDMRRRALEIQMSVWMVQKLLGL